MSAVLAGPVAVHGSRVYRNRRVQGVNPVCQFQPTRLQLGRGADVGWSGTRGDVRAEYLREVDPQTDYFVSERVGVSSIVRPAARWSLAAGADYDLAAGWWGSAEATLGYGVRDVS